MLKNIVKYAFIALKVALIAYAFLYTAAYAYTQKECLSYRFEITQLTWDFRPYCIGLYQGQELVVPLRELQFGPTAPKVGPTL